MTNKEPFKPAPKPYDPEHNPLPVPQRARKTWRQILREMSCRLEGFIIGVMLAGAMAYAEGLHRGNRSAEDCWAALDAANEYQQYGDQEFAKFEREAGRAKR